MEMEVVSDSVDEDYVIQRAKDALKTDPISAKAWMITAKTLYPTNFGVQFEAYRIEKCAGHVQEAAKCFSDLVNKFPDKAEFWVEINTVIAALRPDCDNNETDKQFLNDMFKNMSPDIQRKLLLLMAEHCDDTVEHCKLLLLLLQMFPSAITSHASGLIDTLLSAEKHSHASNQPINNYRKILVCDLLPLLNENNVLLELPQKSSYKLLHKAIEYYLCLINSQGNTFTESAVTDQPWDRLCNILEFTGKQLHWERYLNFGSNWTKESYWQRLLAFCQSKNLNMDEYGNVKQLLYCYTIFFLRCLHDYKISLTPVQVVGQIQTTYALVEAFVDPSMQNVTEPKSKRRKTDYDDTTPYLTIERPDLKHMVVNFNMTVKCWELLTSVDVLQREFAKLSISLKLDTWLQNFLIDYAMYKGKLDEALTFLNQLHEPSLELSKNLKYANIMYLKKSFVTCYEHIQIVIGLFPMNNPGKLSNNLVCDGLQRHLHFLPLTQQSVLQYCTKLLIRAISDSSVSNYPDLSIGNILVLSQLDWPQEEEKIPPLLHQIKQRGAFHYYLFQSYIVNVDILEELMYLWVGQVVLDVVPHLGQRRIGTRGSDKGFKEEIRQAIKRQVARSNEPLDQLIITFITQEKGHISQTLM